MANLFGSRTLPGVCGHAVSVVQAELILITRMLLGFVHSKVRKIYGTHYPY